MYKPNRGNRFGSPGGKKFGGPPPWKKRGFGDDGERAPMHDAVCDQCSAVCQVPFRPTGARPVYCRNCFKKDGDQEPKRFGAKPPFRKYGAPTTSSPNYDAQLRDINRKLDAILEALTGEPAE